MGTSAYQRNDFPVFEDIEVLPIRGPLPRHRASVEIGFLKDSQVITHTSFTGRCISPTVASYKDGIVVGCTFIANEAVEQLYKLHKKFLEGQACVVHQKRKMSHD
jgi:hypothetical protein